MTTRKAWMVCCDEAGCEAMTAHAISLALARQAGFDAGWVRRWSGGKASDFCPQHKRPAVRPGARAECGTCGRTGLRINSDGTSRSHLPPVRADGPRYRYRSRCPGSYRLPAKVEAGQ